MNTCETCGKPCKRRWCTQVCNALARMRGVLKVCLNCGIVFYLRPADERKGGGKYHNEACRRAYQAAHTKEYLKIGRMTVHRIVASQKLGRPLTKGEVVHHIDGDSHNNHPDNLMVLTSQSVHSKIEGNFTNIPIEQRIRNGQKSGDVRRAKRQIKN